MKTFTQGDELEHNVTQVKQVVEHGLASYTLACLTAAQDGYALDLRNRYSPDFSVGLFTANFVKTEAKPVEDMPEGKAASTVGKPKPGRPSKAAQTKELLKATLPADALKTVTNKEEK